MNRLEPKLRIRVKTAEPSVIWRGGRVEKAITVIGVKAIDWPRPSSRLLQKTSKSVRLMSNWAIQKPAAGLNRHAADDGQARRDARELGDEQEGRPVAQAARGDQHGDGIVGIAAQIVQQGREQHQAGEVQHAHDEGEQHADG